MSQTTNGETTLFFHSTEGVIGFRKSNNDYFYCKNAQGDVFAIVNSPGFVVARYKYDAFGNHVAYYWNGEDFVVATPNNTNDNCKIALFNPYRYRSYYFDTETGLYYLNSRYYDPTTGRFLNLDTVDYLDPESINGINLYAYCENNPIAYVDNDGAYPVANTNIVLSDRKTIIKAFENVAFSRLFGNAEISVTKRLVVNNIKTIGSQFSYVTYEQFTNGEQSIGFGFSNQHNWGLSIGISSSGNISLNGQFGEHLHAGISVGTDGLGINLGVDIGDTSYDLDVNIGTTTLALLTTATVIAFVPIPGARVVSGLLRLVSIFA